MLKVILLIAMFESILSLTSQTADVSFHHLREQKAHYLGKEEKLNRKSKFLPLVQLISFENSPCISLSGEVGTCFSKSECVEYIGEASGECAKGYGVCCIVTAKCNSAISVNNTYFQNPEYPTGYTTPGLCTVEVYFPEDTIQVKLELKTFSILGPVDGDCGNDTFIVTGVNPGSIVPILCGENSGQHVFVEVSKSKEPLKLMFSISGADATFNRRFKVKISFLNEYDSCKAPPRCLQYYTDPSGTINSFNYRGTPSMILNDQDYAICFGYHRDLCDVALTFIGLDIGDQFGTDCQNDYLAIAGEKICGTRPRFQLQANATGPIIIYVKSDEDNSDEQEGFLMNYTYLPCTN